MKSLIVFYVLAVLLNEKGMVKLTGPMFSLTALGKFGKALVYSIWKGVQYCRMLVTPVNPQSGSQGDRRVMLGGLGRSPKYVQTLSPYEVHGSTVAPAGQSWISYYIKYIQKTYFTDVAGYDAIYTEWNVHTAIDDFTAEGLALGLVSFDLAYKDMANVFTKGMMMYCLAKFGCDQYLLDNTKFNESPYTTALASWTLTEIQEMVADFAAP